MYSVKRIWSSLAFRTQLAISIMQYRTEKWVRLKFAEEQLWRACDRLIPNSETGPNWKFYDKESALIVNRWEYRSVVKKGGAIRADDQLLSTVREVTLLDNGVIDIDGITCSDDEWVFLLLDPAEPVWPNYSLKLCVTFKTLFKEFQVDFRYVDFFNRYRYRFQDNMLFFDIVYRGEFIPSLTSREFILDLNRQYEIEIRVLGNSFECWIDGIMMAKDFGWKGLERGSIAIILWEDNGKNDLKARIEEVSMTRLVSNAD